MTLDNQKNEEVIVLVGKYAPTDDIDVRLKENFYDKLDVLYPPLNRNMNIHEF